ncbi:hypothetical protein INS49_003254 [Diaporthe citri]|uniref:uncharacterized protein n=1 Tax=Diaporthe citri TaxID=83186 RepID=UPI001C8262C6|nr:uncharacterized protein INS49_003254 [Diaporthe citri]KAG6355293.1 hypothetical protein INS49_003254 [Diaporthe citri]
MAARFAAVDRANASRLEMPEMELREMELPFKLCHVFFYGSLMDAQILQTVAKLANPPPIRNGIVRGFKIKMWGIYPTVVPDKRGVVTGTVWHTDDASHPLHLQEYETRAYKLCGCEVEFKEGHKILASKIFC